MEIKVRYHLIFVRMAITKKKTNVRMWRTFEPLYYNADQTLPWDQVGCAPAHEQGNTTFRTLQTPYPTVSGTGAFLPMI